MVEIEVEDVARCAGKYCKIHSGEIEMVFL
jgi:hypothetical protein